MNSLHFLLLAKSATLGDLELTLNGHYALCYITHILSKPTAKKYGAGILVFSKMRFMRIFAGFTGDGASYEGAVVENGDFRFFRLLYLNRG